MTVSAVKLEDLVDALQWVNADSFSDNEAYLCITTGQIHLHGNEMEVDVDPLPEDIEDSAKYAAIPDKHELQLGTNLVFRFVEDVLPDEYSNVQRIFRRNGAYSRFKDLLEEHSVLKQWYEFEDLIQKEALKDWCVQRGIEYRE